MRTAMAQLNLSTRAYHLTRGVSSLLVFGIHYGVSFDQAPVDMGALFEDAPLGWKVHVDQSKALVYSLRPFQIIQGEQ